jgi:hypothetical protein
MAEFDPQRDVILENGRFDQPRSSRAQLEAIIAAAVARPDANQVPLVLHFHGGLVGESSGLRTARKLQPVYEGAGATPLFVVWKTGFWDSLVDLLTEPRKRRLLDRLRVHIMRFVAGKLQKAEADHTLLASPEELREEPAALPEEDWVEGELARPHEAEPFVYLDPHVLEERDIDPDGVLTEAEKAQIEEMIVTDGELAGEIHALLAGDGGRGAEWLSPAFVEAARPEMREADLRAAAIPPALVVAALRIASRVLVRFVRRRDHGAYSTVVEEILREIYADRLAERVWSEMKGDTGEAFGAGADAFGGTALLEALQSAHARGYSPRIVLVGHSAGAIFICELVKAAAARLPREIVFDVVLLTPACGFRPLREALETGRVANIRVFGMSEAREKEDDLVFDNVPVLRNVYPRSLLYFVSGVCERDADFPLAGMQRYYSGRQPYVGGGFEDVEEIRRLMAAARGRLNWAPTPEVPGFWTTGRDHGAFDEDGPTRLSLQHIIRSGF